MSEIKWSGRSEGPFPEVAEALGIRTDQIIGAHEIGSRITVLFTPTLAVDDDSMQHDVWLALIRRQADGILKVVQRNRTGETFQQFVDKLEGQIVKKFGKPAP